MRDAALDKKGESYEEIDVAGRTILADTFVLVTGRSKIQTRAIADSIAEKVKASGHPVLRTEGYSDGGWILLDLGETVVHIFTPEEREFYNLERLWTLTPSTKEQLS